MTILWMRLKKSYQYVQQPYKSWFDCYKYWAANGNDLNNKVHKLTATLALLCFSAASFAEVYVCKSEKQFYLNRDFSDSWISASESISVDVIVDTSQGLLFEGMTSENYVGACRYSSYGGHFCTWQDDSTLFQVIVEELANGIFFTYTDLSSDQIMNSGGSCTKAPSWIGC